MALFYVGFATDHQPLLIDANDPPHALEIAASVAPDERPSRVTSIPPGIVVCGLFTEPDEDEGEEGEELVIDPLPHVVDYLEKIDALEDEPAATCSERADAQGDELVSCTKPHGHEPPHESVTADGQIVQW